MPSPMGQEGVFIMQSVKFNGCVCGYRGWLRRQKHPQRGQLPGRVAVVADGLGKDFVPGGLHL